MNKLNNGSSNNIELWLNLNEKILKSSVNTEEVREILRRNVKFKGSEEFFSVVAVNMKDLGVIVFDNLRYFSSGEMHKRISFLQRNSSLSSLSIISFDSVSLTSPTHSSTVLRIALEFSKLALSLSPPDYVQSFKTFLLMLRTNQNLIKTETTLLELPIAYVSSNLIDTFMKVHEIFNENW
jgi:hypothetical protein